MRRDREPRKHITAHRRRQKLSRQRSQPIDDRGVAQVSIHVIASANLAANLLSTTVAAGLALPDVVNTSGTKDAFSTCRTRSS